MYAQLGTIQFEGLFSYDTFRQETETRYAEIALLNGKADLQMTGLELDQITIGVRLHTRFCNPRLRYQQMEDHRVNGDILAFVDGKGNLIGNFVITKNAQTYLQTGSLGEVMCSECELTLREYVSPDRIAARAAAAKNKATALGEIPLSRGLTTVTASISPATDVFASITATQSSSFAAALAVTGPNPSTADVNEGLTALQKVQQGIDSVNAKIDKYETEVSVGAAFWGNLSADAVSLATAAQQMKITLQNFDVANFKSASELLLQVASRFTTDGLPLQKILILRK